MKNVSVFILSIICVLFLSTQSLDAQCANDNVLTTGSLTPPGVSQTAGLSFGAGQYVLAYVQKGAQYTVSTCNAGYYDEWGDWIGPFDTQLTLYYDDSGVFVGYNDDYCGLLSTVSFTATRCGWVRIELDQYSCNNSGLLCPVEMTQNTAGTSTLAVAMNPDTITCPGIPMSIGGNAINGTSPYTYSWNYPALLAYPDSAHTDATVYSTTGFMLTVTDADHCSVSGSTSLLTYSQPVVNLGNDTLVCGNDLLLDASNALSLFNWNDSSTLQTLLVDTTGNYFVAVTNSDGCIGSDTIHVTIHHLPIIELGNDSAYCGGQQDFDLTQPGTGYLWNDGSLLPTYTAFSTGMVAALLTDSVSGCTNTDTTQLTFYALPVVSLGEDTLFCQTDFTIEATPGFSSYLWSDFSTDTNLIVSITGIYSVEILDTNGCSDIDSIEITMFDNPMVHLGNDTAFCAGSIILDAENPGSDYLWTDLSTQQTLLVNSGGTYNVEVTDTNNCVGADSIEVTIFELPVVDISSSPTTLCLSHAPSVLTGSPAGGSFSGAGVTGNNFDPQVAGVGNHAIVYTYSDLNDCENSDTIIFNVLACLGVEDNSSFKISVFPNPADGWVNVQVTNSFEGDLLIRVSDLQGKVLNQYTKGETVPGSTFQIDLAGMTKGMYLITIQSGLHKATERIILR